jgi:peptidoglycan/LPS O-acetylase OafA/YrhL
VPALLEFCRGAAILGVVGVHAVHGWFGWQGVHVFVVAGGFALAWGALARDESPDWRAWARRRVARILPTYWATALAGFAVVWLATALRTGEAEDAVRAPLRQLALDLALLRDLDWRAAFGDPNASLWYVPLLAASTPRSRGSTGACARRATTRRSRASSPPRSWSSSGGGPRPYSCSTASRSATGTGSSRTSYRCRRSCHGSTTAFRSRSGRRSASRRPGSASSRSGWPPRFGSRGSGRRRSVRSSGGRAAAAGAAAWLAGNVSLQWRAGWVVADLLIAGGLTVLVLAAAARLAPRRGRTWRLGTWLGAWAYYLFLAHLLVGYVVAQAIALAPPSSLVLVPAVPAAVGGLVLACRALRALDRSALPARVGRALVRQP